MNDEPMMVVSLEIDSQVRMTVPVGHRRQALAELEARCKTEFGEFSRHLMEQGLDALFRISHRETIRRDPERRFSPVDVEPPSERRWPLRVRLLAERDNLQRVIAAAPDEGPVDRWALERLNEINQQLGE